MLQLIFIITWNFNDYLYPDTPIRPVLVLMELELCNPETQEIEKVPDQYRHWRHS